MKETEQLQVIMPFFVVSNVDETISFYKEKLGFSVHFQQILPSDDIPSFCILGRNQISIMFKSIFPAVGPTPNSANHKWARWDAYIATNEPDSLFEEFQDNGVEFYRELEDTDDGLRAFEVKDNSGYILCFAKPRQ